LLSFTDVDLFTKDQSDYCLGYGIPGIGGIKSIHRFRPEFTGELFSNDYEFEAWSLIRICKIATQ